jgi:signal transduction histidine kinase
VFATGVAFAITLALARILPVPTDVVFAGAVVVSAWYGGRGPGFLSGALSILGIDYADLPPIGRIELAHPAEVVHFGVFLIVVLIISSTTEALRRARATSELRTRDLEQLNGRLAHQMEEARRLWRELQSANEDLVASRDDAERVAARASRLREVTSALSDAGTSAEVGRVVAHDGLDAIQAVGGYLGALSADGSTIEMLSARALPPELENRMRVLPLSGPHPLAHAVRTREALWFASASEMRDRFPHADALFVRPGARQTHAYLPLLHRGEVIGGLALSFDEPTATGAVDHAFTLLLAQATAAALYRARSYDAEREKRREAELLARAREDVLGVVAHDLRNPLNLVGTTVEVVAEEDLDPVRRRQLVDIARRAVAQMDRLIGDLLDSVRLQAGHLSLEVQPVTVHDILHRTEEMFRPGADSRHIRLETVSPPGDGVIQADGDRLLQALGNLVGNALKFTPPGGTVIVRAQLPDDRREVRFEVADDGPGIPPDNLDRLFDRFWQARSADRRGVGLGLAIAKGIVEAHGGHIEVQSRLGAGSTFAIRLPAVPAERSDGSLTARAAADLSQPSATNAV